MAVPDEKSTGDHGPELVLTTLPRHDQAQRTQLTTSIWLLMVIDGAATVGVVQDEAMCVDVVDCNSVVQVGGNGEPTYLSCKRTGWLCINQIVDGRSVRHRVRVRIIPGFGINVLPECHFLRLNMSVNKTGSVCEISDQDGRVHIRARALHHVKDSWLFYTRIRLDGGLAAESNPNTRNSPAIKAAPSDVALSTANFNGELLPPTSVRFFTRFTSAFLLT